VEHNKVKNKLKRINFLDIPVNALNFDETLDAIKDFIKANDGQTHQIVLLDIRKLLRAKVDRVYYRCLKTASLILPVSRGITRGARFQNKMPLSRYNLFDFVIRLLSVADELKQSVYLFGSKKEELEKAEKNLRISFPNVHIVGRFYGYLDAETEKKVILAIKKSSPAFILVGKGIKDRDKWIMDNRDNFNPGIFLSVDNCFEIFSGKEKNIPKALFNLGLESLPQLLKRPWRIFYIFPFLYFKILVLIYRIRGL
jgi:N-acetylglucosaminyldiphosphoundecaprenol N-acetyl-beta-D-mannosaminyltransferase